LADNLIWLSEQTGKRYVRTDKATKREPHVGSPANLWEISIKGNWDSNSGEMGIVKVALENTTERAVMFPKRGGAYNPKHIDIQPRPHYYRTDPETGEMLFTYMEQCTTCYHYQKREAFGPDKRKRNGLQSSCRTCEADRLRRFRAA
jgi:hypothetical protein